MKNKFLIDVEIDKLTNSIQNIFSGDGFDTDLFRIFTKDTKAIKKVDWQFDWKNQIEQTDREIYKLVIKNNPQIIQGLISISYQYDHIYMHLIESAKFNKGKQKIYAGVPGNLVAFACKCSFEKGYGGYVGFDAKTLLIKHYKETLFATHFKGTKMFIQTNAANKLINKYFNK